MVYEIRFNMENLVGDTEVAQPQKRLLTPFMKRKVIPIPTEEERKPFPMNEANIFSVLYFTWLWPLLKVGYRRTLTEKDLYTLTDDLKVETLLDQFLETYVAEKEKYQNLHLKAKLLERGEEVSSVSEKEDLFDFKLTKFNMIWILLKTFKRRVLWVQFFACIAMIGYAVLPLLTKEIIKFVELKAFVPSTNVGRGVGYSIGMVLISILNSLCLNHFFFQGTFLGIQVKSILITQILEKSFKLNPESRHKYTISKITSMMSTDLNRIEQAVFLQPIILAVIAPIIISIVILVTNIGVSAVVGLAVFFLVLGLLGFAIKELFAQREIVATLTDIRVRIIKEIINNIKTIKLYSWEAPYLKSMIEARGNEVKVIMVIQRIRNVVTAIALSLTGIISMISFLVLYGIDGNTRSPADIFSSISSFEIISTFMTFIPMCLSTTADLLQGLDRIGEFLTAPELEVYDGYTINENPDHKFENAIEIENAEFKWEIFDEIEDEEDGKAKKKLEKNEEKKKKKFQFFKKETIQTEIAEIKKEENSEAATELTIIKDNSIADEDKANTFHLHNINLNVKKGEFIVVTGVIGSGKSSLLSAIAGFMDCNSGYVNINGSILNCGAPWVQNATIRENITFGKQYNQKVYDEVVYACSLQSDLSILPAGDLTEVGEKGITLSGGQKARINLARAVYADKDIILLDDVLSAVDARVGKHIIENCLLRLLLKKTRILATHQLSLIDSADRIIFLKSDGTIDVGELKELMEKNADFKKLMAFMEQDEQEQEDGEEDIVEEIVDDLADSLNTYDGGSEINGLDSNNAEKSIGQGQVVSLKRRSTKNTTKSDEEAIYYDMNAIKDLSKAKITEKEEVAVNQIGKEVYHQYLKFGSGRLTCIGFLIGFGTILALATFAELFTNTWLSFWLSRKFDGRSNGFYIGIYVMLNIAWVILLTLTFITLIGMTVNASKNLHLAAIKRVLHTPMAYVDVTPIGRILNRFTTDTDALDNNISEQARILFTSVAKVIGVFILCIIYIPWIAIAVPPIMIALIAIANYYQASNREVKRLEATQRSHVYSNFNEVLSGANTIKAYKQDERFYERNNKLINEMNEASYIVYSLQRWIDLLLDVLALSFVLIVSILCVNNVFKLNAASVGLLVSYAISLSQILSFVVRTYTEFENDMNSGERVIFYALKLPQEAPFVIDNTQPDSDWPRNGEVVFDKVNLAYRPGLPLVLKDLSFKIGSGEKIGICGRTGAGKSSILTALYRIAEIDLGKILIDNVDISKIGLEALRSHLSIIPQDPVLFSGSIKKNLDPFSEHSDEKLWDALRRANLLTAEDIEAAKGQSKDDDNLNKFHLEQFVEDEGSNFSLGERQLIAFARALVRETKVLVLDEATSSVDYETDAKIQQTISTEFKHCTILCIAHRLKTILNYDRIIILDKGQLMEIDTPVNLFRNEGSIFRQMCEKSNLTIDDFKQR